MLQKYGFLTWIFFLALAAQTLAAQLPREEKELPIFPVAVRDRAVEAELQAAEPDRPTVQGWEAGIGAKLSSAHLAFNSGLPAEEIFNFYLQAFGVPLGDNEPVPPLDRLSFHTDASFIDCYNGRGEKISEGIKTRARMEQNRRPFRPGKWLDRASFFWVVEETSGDFSELTLHIHDLSLACKEGKSQKGAGTQIQFSRLTWQRGQKVMAETEPSPQRDARARERF